MRGTRPERGWLAGVALTGLLVLGSLALCLSALAADAGAIDEKLDLTGDVRLRLRHIDSPDTGALAGTYGEALTEGLSLRHRFVLEAAYALTKTVTAGGMLRASNEGEAVLEAGPEYLSSEFGSAFIAYETPTLRSRLGYYTIAYSPLTLMRWDTTDDPEGGGGGCGCGGGAAAGAILGETLEELGPNLTFEGGRASLSPGGDLGFDAFIARPREAGTDYQLVTYGGRASYVRYVADSKSFLDIGLLAVRSEEDKHSLPEGTVAGIATANTVYGATWKLPIPAPMPISFEGEWTSTRSSGLWDEDGFGIIASLKSQPRPAIKTEASYIYLSENWDSYFRALSYNPDRKGFRLGLEYQQAGTTVALFARVLKTTDSFHPSGYAAAIPGEAGTAGPAAAAASASSSGSETAYQTFSTRGHFRISPAQTIGLAGIYAAEGDDDDSFIPSADTRRTTAIASLVYEFAKDASLTLEERYIWNRVEHATVSEHDYDVSMISLYVRAGLW